MHTYLIIALIFFLGSFVQGLTGFGLALVAIPLLVQIIDIRLAVPLCMLNGLVLTGYLSLQLKKHTDKKKITPLLIGCLVGIPVGVFLLKKIDISTFKLLLGGLLVAYGTYSLFIRDRISGTPKTIRPFWGYVAGFGTGAISAAFSAGGPPTIIYTTLTGWSKDQIKATLSVFFFLGGLGAALAHALSGLTTVAVFTYLCYTIPAVLIGVYSGSRLYQRFQTDTYLKIVLAALILMGGFMIFTSI